MPWEATTLHTRRCWARWTLPPTGIDVVLVGDTLQLEAELARGRCRPPDRPCSRGGDHGRRPGLGHPVARRALRSRWPPAWSPTARSMAWSRPGPPVRPWPQRHRHRQDPPASSRPAIATIFPMGSPDRGAGHRGQPRRQASDPRRVRGHGLGPRPRSTSGIEQPEVGLLNIGEEPGKGRHWRTEAHDLLVGHADRLHRERRGRDLGTDRADVFVTDGFTGNVVLKTAEGTARAVARIVLEALAIRRDPAFQEAVGAVLPKLLAVREQIRSRGPRRRPPRGGQGHRRDRPRIVLAGGHRQCAAAWPPTAPSRDLLSQDRGGPTWMTDGSLPLEQALGYGVLRSGSPPPRADPSFPHLGRREGRVQRAARVPGRCRARSGRRRGVVPARSIMSEGAMAKTRAEVVDRARWPWWRRSLGLGEQLLIGAGRRRSRAVRDKPSILADAMEAVLGAIYLDGGMDAARTLILDRWEDADRERAAAPGVGRLQDPAPGSAGGRWPDSRIRGGGVRRPDHDRSVHGHHLERAGWCSASGRALRRSEPSRPLPERPSMLLAPIPMPELPEVETTRRHLAPALTGRTIAEVEVRRPRMVRRQARPADFADRLTGRTVRAFRSARQVPARASVGRHHLGHPSRDVGPDRRSQRRGDPRPPTPTSWSVSTADVEFRMVDPRTFGFVAALLPDELAADSLAAWDPMPWTICRLRPRLWQRGWRAGRCRSSRCCWISRFLAGLGQHLRR